MQEYITNYNESRRVPLAQEIANKIVKYCSENKLQPGDRLPSEYELADLFQVGRGTVREAVKLLVSRNVLEIRRAKGTFLCDNPGVSDDPFGLSFVADKVKLFNDLLEMRIVLERFSVRKAALMASEEQIRELQSYVDIINQSLDEDRECVEADLAFHKLLSEIGGNLVMPIVLPIIISNIRDFNSLKFIRHWNIANRGHQQIVDAIKKQDPGLAEEEMINHLGYVSEKMKGIEPELVRMSSTED